MSSVATTNEDFKIFDFLAPKVWGHLTKEEIKLLRNQVKHGIIHIESLVENALAKASRGKYKRIAEEYRDFTDNSDAKKVVSNLRNNIKAKGIWTNSFAVTGLEKKIGLVRVVCYSKQQDQFYFFAIPHKAYAGRSGIEISADTVRNHYDRENPPLVDGIPKGKWCKYQVNSFARLATITEKEALKLGE